MNFQKLALILLTPMLFAGCIEMTAIYTLNPDGSGKVDLDIVMSKTSDPENPSSMPAIPMPDLDTQARKMLKNMLENPKIDAWSDMSWELTKEKKIHIKATSYFKDLNSISGDSPGEKITWSRNDKGEMVLLMNMIGEETSKTPPPAIPADQLDDAIKTAREQWKITREIMIKMMGQMKTQVVFRLPGKIGEVTGFVKNADGSLKLDFDGKKYFELLDKVMADDKALGELIKSGKSPLNPGSMSEQMCQELFGTKGVMKTVVSGELIPIFDYKTEMEKAKAAMPEMIKSLKLDELPKKNAVESPKPATEPGK